jgi:hypothetical protein
MANNKQNERRTPGFQETALSGSDKFDIYFPAYREEDRVPVAQRKNSLGAAIREKAAILGLTAVAAGGSVAAYVGLQDVFGTHFRGPEQPLYPTVPPEQRYDHLLPDGHTVHEAGQAALAQTITTEAQTP